MLSYEAYTLKGVQLQMSIQYLGSIISKDKEIEEDVDNRIRVGQLKRRLTSRVPCDRQYTNKIRGKFLQNSD